MPTNTVMTSRLRTNSLSRHNHLMSINCTVALETQPGRSFPGLEDEPSNDNTAPRMAIRRDTECQSSYNTPSRTPVTSE